MKNLVALFSFLLVISASAYAAAPETVEFVDVQKYMGRWYEIAKFSNTFQKGCAATIAEYRLQSNGKVAVLNSCKKENGRGIKKAKGTAYVVDKSTNSKLKVSFVPLLQNFGLFAGDYWILALDADYQYVLVGSPDRKYLWILSRTPTLDQVIVEDLKLIAEEKGYDASKLITTPTWLN